MSDKRLFIYDGECPFCNHFAQLLELKSSIPDLEILDGRKIANDIKDEIADVVSTFVLSLCLNCTLPPSVPSM